MAFQNPVTPVNSQNNHQSPRAPTRHTRADGQRHPPLTLLPPSASNFLNQQHFPSLLSPQLISHDQRPHTVPSHYPQPHFFQRPHHHQFYSQQPYDHQYFPQQYYYHPPNFPSNNMNNVPLPTAFLPTAPLFSNNTNNVPFHTIPTSSPSVQSTVPKSLPSVTHIPVLSRRSDFSAWNNGVRLLILYLGFAGHIAGQPSPGSAPWPDRIPTYPPFLSVTPTAAELASSRTWWDKDNVVSHVLTSRLAASVLSILPFDDDDEHIEP